MGNVIKKRNFVESFHRMIDNNHYVTLTNPIHYYHYEGKRINAFINDVFYGTDAKTNEPLVFYVNRFGQALSITNPQIVELFKRNFNLFVLGNGVIIFWNKKEMFLTIDMEDLFEAPMPEELSPEKYDIAFFATYNHAYYVKMYKLEDGSIERYNIKSYINLGPVDYSIRINYFPVNK